MLEDAYTIYTMPVNAGDYNLLVSFCEDFDIPNIPKRENCFFSLNAFFGLHEKLPQSSAGGFLMNELELVVEDSVEGDKKLLVISGTSPLLEKAFINHSEMLIRKGHDPIEEEPNTSVVLASDFDSDSDYDLGHMTMKLKEYLGDTLAFTEYQTRYVQFDYLMFLFDGEQPVQE